MVKNLKKLCQYAQRRGKKIAIEPLNRFETDFINTCEAGQSDVGERSKSCSGIHLDTFHMNIDIRPGGAICQAGKNLFHLHAVAGDRGTPGSDHIDGRVSPPHLRELVTDKTW